jgi:excisionase family DNA binding protein
MALMIEGQEFFTTAEACAALGIKPATLYAYVSRGLLRSYRQGIKRRRLYRRVEVEALLRFEPGRRGAASVPELPTAESWIPYT